MTRPSTSSTCGSRTAGLIVGVSLALTLCVSSPAQADEPPPDGHGLPPRSTPRVAYPTILPPAPFSQLDTYLRPPMLGKPRHAATYLPGDELWGNEFGLPVVDGWVNCAIRYENGI